LRRPGLLLLGLALAGCASQVPPPRSYTPPPEGGGGWDRDAPVLPLPAPTQIQRVTLLANEDGTVGAVDVTSAAGAAALDEAGEGVSFDAPDEPYLMGAGEVEALLAQAGVVELPSAESFGLYFRLGSDRLTREASTRLPSILAAITGRSAPEVRLVANSDRVGGDEYNRKLAGRRAAVVRQALIDAGVPAERIEVTVHGEENLPLPTEDGVAEPRNRRVEIRVR
jgi:outer membrane protein OmpA-like peptidoglycan-associated protein